MDKIIRNYDVLTIILSHISDIKTILSLKHVNSFTFNIEFDLNINSNQTFKYIIIKYLFITSRSKKLYHSDSILGLYIDDIQYINSINKFKNLRYLNIYRYPKKNRHFGDKFIYDINLFPTTLEYISTDCIRFRNINKYFNNLKILKLMYEPNNGIYDLSIGIIDDTNYLPQLTELYIKNMVTCNDDIIIYTTLQVLYINSLVSNIDYKILDHLRELKVLMLNTNLQHKFIYNDITIKEKINFANLKEVFMNHTFRNDALQYMFNLEKLYLSNQILSNRDFMNLTNLKELYIESVKSTNYINIHAFDQLIQLEVLICYDTIFDEYYDINDMFLNLVNLKTLILFNNIISDRALINTNKLEKLYCRLNTFTDKVFEYIPNLTNLNLGSNKYITGNTFHLIPKVKRLNLSNATKIKCIKLQAFKNLIHLNAGSFSQITSDHLQYFKELRQLILNLSGDITDFGIKTVPKLTHLELGFNREVTDIGISYLQQLTYLSIGHNTKITIKVLENVPSLLYIHIDYKINSKNFRLNKIKENKNLSKYRRNIICKNLSITYRNRIPYNSIYNDINNVNYFNKLSYKDKNVQKNIIYMFKSYQSTPQSALQTATRDVSDLYDFIYDEYK